MGILLVITTFGVANYNYTSKKQAVEATAEKLKQSLIQAKSNVASGKKNCAVCGCTGGSSDRPLVGWKVLVKNTDKTIEMIGYCGTFSYIFSTNVTKYNNGVSIGPETVVTFIPPNGATYGDVSKDFVITNSVATRNVKVNNLGRIWIE